MNGIYLLLGSNMGDRAANLRVAAKMLEAHEISVLRRSSLYETAAWGIEEQAAFLNQVIEVRTRLSAEALLQKIMQIELDMGRKRIVKWGARLIDIDILYYGTEVHQSQRLTVPHPGIPDRRFTLIPLVELAADLPHPVTGLSQQQLLDRCKDSLEVRLIEEPF